MDGNKDGTVDVTLRYSNLLESGSVNIRHLLTVSADIDGSPSGFHNDDTVSSLV
jgi:hypothetical protein